MKKIRAALFAGYILSTTIVSVCSAQTIASVDINKELTDPGILNRNKKILRLQEISAKALRDFDKTFKNAENISWFRVKGGFMVYFYREGYKTICGYDSKGNWIYNMESYPESQMPEPVRHRVKIAYYDCTILWVNEIALPDSEPIYIVHTEDKYSFNNIRVSAEDMDVIEKIYKE